MVVTVQDGRIVGIEGDPLNPATEGGVCVKGLSYAERAHHPDRLTSPLRRSPAGGLDPVSWHQALDEIVERLDVIRAQWGPLSVLYLEGSGSHGALSAMSDAFWVPFGGCTRAHGDLCWPAGLEATRLTYGANLHSHPVLTRKSRFILLWGHNPAETNIHQWRFILDAQEQGARVAVIDPRSTDTTDAADVHLRPRPGTDAALALGMAQVIVSEGLHDEAFLSEHAHGFEAYRERLREFPLARVAKVTGLEEGEIQELARAYATTRPALLIAGFGMQRHRRAGQAARAACLLPALTGNVGVPGGGWQYANLASHRLRPPPGLPQATNVAKRTFPTSRLGWALQSLSDPPLRAAWIEKANPLSQHPHTERVRKGVAGLDLLVVVDHFLTDSARMADFVLPAKTLFEEEDLVTAYWHPYVQLRQKVLQPPRGVKTETEIWRELCGRFGFRTDAFQYNPEARLRRMLPAGRGEELDELRKRPLDFSDMGDVAWADLRFDTPSGKVEFTSEDAARLWNVDPVPDHQSLVEGHGSELARQFPLQLLTCKTRERIHSQFGNLSSIQEIERPRVLDVHPQDASARGLEDGELAEVWNDRGSVQIRIRYNPGILPGVVHVIEGRCVDDDPWMNLLTDDGTTDMGHGAVFYECLVEVRPV